MKRIGLAVALVLTASAACPQPSEALLLQGVQGWPHGGNTWRKMYYRRHGLKMPAKYRHRASY